MAGRPTDRPEIQVFDEIGNIEHLVRASITKHLPVGLTYPQFEVLNYLIRGGERRTPARIAGDLQMTKGAITNTLQRLGVRSLVTVEGDDVDRRKKYVTVAAEGLVAYNQALESLRPRMGDLRDGFTDREFHDALPFLRALRTWLEESF